jgi:hypothetical protein
MKDAAHSLTVNSVRTIFWLVLAFAASTLIISVGVAWAFLQWTGVLESGRLGAAFLVLGLGGLGVLGCLAGIITWFHRRTTDLRA